MTTTPLRNHLQPNRRRSCLCRGCSLSRRSSSSSSNHQEEGNHHSPPPSPPPRRHLDPLLAVPEGGAPERHVLTTPLSFTAFDAPGSLVAHRRPQALRSQMALLALGPTLLNADNSSSQRPQFCLQSLLEEAIKIADDILVEDVDFHHHPPNPCSLLE